MVNNMYELDASQGIRDLLLYPTRGLSLHPYVGYCDPIQKVF